MIKHFDSSSTFINNETKIALYIEIAKPLILSLPDINDRVKAVAWFRKIIFDNSILVVRIEYLELLLKFLKHKKLSGPFAGLPDTRRPLQRLNNKRIKVQQYSRDDNKINTFINNNNIEEVNTPENTLRCNCVKVINHENDLKHKGNKRISAGYSPFTNKEIKHQIRNSMNSHGNDYEKIKRCKDILNFNSLVPVPTSDDSELNRLDFEKQSVSRRKREKNHNKYKITPVYEEYNHFKKVFCKDNCIRKAKLEYDEYQHLHSKDNKIAENVPIKATLKEENNQNKELDQYCEISNCNEIESFLVGSKKYLTLCVSKESLVERNILKCIKYIISNSQCKFFKFKEYCNLEKNFNMTKPINTSTYADTSKDYHDNSFVNKENHERKHSASSSYEPQINQPIFIDNSSYLTRLRNSFTNNFTFENACDVLKNMVGSSIYVKMSLIISAGIIFFWKLYQIIFACQCKRVGYSTRLVKQISSIRKDVCSPYIVTFVGCFIFYEIVKDFMNIFFEQY